MIGGDCFGQGAAIAALVWDLPTGGPHTRRTRKRQSPRAAQTLRQSTPYGAAGGPTPCRCCSGASLRICVVSRVSRSLRCVAVTV